MALIRTLTISTTAFERTKEKFYSFWQTELCHAFIWCERFRSVAESKQTLKLAGHLTSELMIIIQYVSQGPIAPLFIVCGEALTITSETIKTLTKSAAEFTQLH